MLDDGLSFVGTQANALGYRGPGDNVVGGANTNFVNPDALFATVAGGERNHVTEHYGNIGGGADNTAGYAATVPGGLNNGATSYSFAAGLYAQAIHENSFVWSDGTWTGGYVYSPAANTFSAHASGGVIFGTHTTGAFTGCSIPTAGGSWSCTSDRNAKENFRPVDGRRVLEKVAGLPITSWNYKGQNDRFRHIGPTAQDFKAAFRVGEDDKTISMVDADGVALAAVQALHRENGALKRQNATQQRQIDRLSRSVAELARRASK